jgi:hypothetical protein
MEHTKMTKKNKDYKFEAEHATNNLILRFIGNRCSYTLSFAIMQLVKLDEEGKTDTFMYRYWLKITNALWVPVKKWGTLYKMVR